MKSTFIRLRLVNYIGNSILAVWIVSLILASSLLSSAQVVTLGEFTKLKTFGDVSVELIRSTENKAEYEIEKGFEKDLVFETKEEFLTIRVKAPENSKYNRLITKAQVKLYYKEIKEINIGAISSVSTRDTLISPFLKISCNKGSRGRLSLKCFYLSMEAFHKATLYVNGHTETLKLEATTHSVIEAESLKAKEIEVLVSSDARISVFCEKSIHGKASSGGKLRYKGNPQYKNVTSEAGGTVTGPGE